MTRAEKLVREIKRLKDKLRVAEEDLRTIKAVCSHPKDQQKVVHLGLKTDKFEIRCRDCGKTIYSN